MNTVTCQDRSFTPSKIVCVGRNYVAHIEELGNEIPRDMVVFMKPNSALSDSLSSVHGDEQLHYEGELALLVENGTFSAAGFGLDLTKRLLQSDLKRSGLPWERAKAFDGAVVVSEFVPFGDDPNGLGLSLEIDGEVRQQGHCGLMMYPPAAILAQLAQFVSLEDGDIVMTGTPAGVGPVQRGSRFTGTVTNHGQPLLECSWQAK